MQLYVNYYRKMRTGLHVNVEKERRRALNRIDTTVIDATENTARYRNESYVAKTTHRNAEKYSILKYKYELLYAEILKEHEGVIERSYHTFKIPKASGGWRLITAPNEDLKTIQTAIAEHIIKDCKYLPHDSVHSYTKRRNCLTALQVHQRNKSKYFLKLDIQDFFPSCTKDVVQKALGQLLNTTHMASVLPDACFYNGALPQGSPASPILSNIVLQDFDYKFNIWCRHNGLTYTRYADDLLISGRKKFNFQKVVETAQTLLPETLHLKMSKTRFGSCCGRNWNLGLMYNKDGNITVGHKQKHQIQCAYHNLYKEELDKQEFDKQLLSLIGLFQYYKFIEPEYFTALERKLNAKGYVTK